MYEVLKYIAMSFAVVLLQLFFVDTLNLGLFVNPLLYVSLIVLLPMNMPPIAVLFSGFCLGVVMDVATGMGGACTAATLLTAYLRSYLLDLIMGKEVAAGGGMPSFDNPSTGKFLRYVAAAVSVHCIAFFSLETMTLSFFHLTLLRIVLSGAATFICVIVVTLLFSRKKY